MLERVFSADDVECDRDQDICITIAMNMGRESGWWLQMGCAQRARFMNIKNMGDCVTTVQDQVETYYDRNMGGHKKTRTKKVGMHSWNTLVEFVENNKHIQ